jgi:segregation and condensation protein B
LEAVLFLAREPLNTRKLAQLAHLADGTEARTLVRRLNRFYDETGSAFAAEELAGGFQLMSRPKFATWLGRLYQNPVEIRLSGPALETLAVVAYRQPVMRAEIEAIRGVDCGEILRQLLERNLVRTAGRAEELGRPYLYATTKRFLQVFGLRGLEDLPRAESLRGPTAAAPQAREHSHANQSRPNEIHNESLTQTTARENEEGFERDHHRPA